MLNYNLQGFSNKFYLVVNFQGHGTFFKVTNCVASSSHVTLVPNILQSWLRIRALSNCAPLCVVYFHRLAKMCIC